MIVNRTTKRSSDPHRAPGTHSGQQTGCRLERARGAHGWQERDAPGRTRSSPQVGGDGASTPVYARFRPTAGRRRIRRWCSIFWLPGLRRLDTAGPIGHSATEHWTSSGHGYLPTFMGCTLERRQRRFRRAAYCPPDSDLVYQAVSMPMPLTVRTCPGGSTT